jgi:hypothetical protein
LVCFNRILSLGRAEISGNSVPVENSPCNQPLTPVTRAAQLTWFKWQNVSFSSLSKYTSNLSLYGLHSLYGKFICKWKVKSLLTCLFSIRFRNTVNTFRNSQKKHLVISFPP